MLQVEACRASPTAARWLKLLSARVPVSVTRPILMVFCGVPPPVVPPPQAARTRARSRLALRASKRIDGFLIDPPLAVRLIRTPRFGAIVAPKYSKSFSDPLALWRSDAGRH